MSSYTLKKQFYHIFWQALNSGIKLISAIHQNTIYCIQTISDGVPFTTNVFYHNKYFFFTSILQDRSIENRKYRPASEFFITFVICTGVGAFSKSRKHSGQQMLWLFTGRNSLLTSLIKTWFWKCVSFGYSASYPEPAKKKNEKKKKKKKNAPVLFNTRCWTRRIWGTASASEHPGQFTNKIYSPFWSVSASRPYLILWLNYTRISRCFRPVSNEYLIVFEARTRYAQAAASSPRTRTFN